MRTLNFRRVVVPVFSSLINGALRRMASRLHPEGQRWLSDMSCTGIFAPSFAAAKLNR